MQNFLLDRLRCLRDIQEEIQSRQFGKEKRPVTRVTEEAGEMKLSEESISGRKQWSNGAVGLEKIRARLSTGLGYWTTAVTGIRHKSSYSGMVEMEIRKLEISTGI